MDFTPYYVNIAIYSLFNLVFGLYSHLIKEQLFLSETLVAVLFGVAFGPRGLNLIFPARNQSSFSLWILFYQFARLVMAFQTMAAGISLPKYKAYLRKKWRALATLLGPVMLGMWLVSSVIVYLLFHGDGSFSWLESMVLGACITPTDPVLASSIVKGRFAEKHIPEHVRDLLSAESGANDGAALPLLYLPILLLKESRPQTALLHWIRDVWLYKVLLSLAVGSATGWLANRMLKYSQRHEYTDKQSLLAFSLILALLLTTGMTAIGSNDMLAVFMAGTVFAWDDWFVDQTRESQLQPVVDSIFNFTFFVLFGAALPWAAFASLGWMRLVAAVLLLLLLRRLPLIILFCSWNRHSQLNTRKERLFAGWFGPIGVGAIFYAALAVFELDGLTTHQFMPVTCFVVMGSVIAHGIIVPLFHLTITRQITLPLEYLRIDFWESDTVMPIKSDSQHFQREPPSHSWSSLVANHDES